MRLFIALEIPAAVKKEIVVIQKYLGVVKGIKWINPENIHLTLKFLDNVGNQSFGDFPQSAAANLQNRLNIIKESLSRAVAGFHPFVITTAQVGIFPHFRSPRVIWLGIEDQTGLLFSLRQRVEAILSEIGFASEKRKFKPHLTLGRIRFPQKKIDLKKMIAAWESLKKGKEIIVDKIELIESKLRPEGAVYFLVESFRLEA